MARLVLVDEHGTQIGTEDKLAAHQPPGRLHRAISVFVLDGTGRVLLQRRAAAKYHFAGLWANTACSHPAPGEPVVAAGERRLGQEMGLDVALNEVGAFTYRAIDPVSGLVEHEFDHVLAGFGTAEPKPDPAEVGAWRWIGFEELRSELLRQPDRFAPWLEPALGVLDASGAAPGAALAGD